MDLIVTPKSSKARHPESTAGGSAQTLSPEDFETLVKNRTREERDAGAIELAERKGLRPELFCKAFGLAHTLVDISVPKREVPLSILARRNYELLEQVLIEQRNDVLRELISSHLQPGVVFDQARLADYSIKPVVTAHRGSYRGRASADPANLSTDREDKSMPYMDAPFGLILCYRGVENAIVTMWPDRKNPDTLLIPQIQGVKKIVLGEDGRTVLKRQHSRGLNGFEWGDVLVEYATILARSLGYEKIAIQSAHNNYWTGPDGEGKVHLPLEKGLAGYDRRAARLGFVEQFPATAGLRPNWEKVLG
jgi:hypothetical protein